MKLNPDKLEVLMVGGEMQPILDEVAFPFMDQVHRRHFGGGENRRDCEQQARE